jgi:hypothetical protein
LEIHTMRSPISNGSTCTALIAAILVALAVGAPQVCGADKPAPTEAAKPPKTSAPPDTGPGAVVWLDTATKTYYCADDPSFGKTKEGYLIPEKHAQARGGRPSEGRACS